MISHERECCNWMSLQVWCGCRHGVIISRLVQKVITPCAVFQAELTLVLSHTGQCVTAHTALQWEYCPSGAKMLYFFWNPNPFFILFHVLCIWIVCFSELVKLFCTEESHRKELKLFLRGLITSLHVSDAGCLQTSITTTQLVQSQSARHSQCYRSYVHTLPSRSWLELQLIGCFKERGEWGHVHLMATCSHRRGAAQQKSL